MIRFSILRLDDGGGGALAWAKAQCRRLYEAGDHWFARTWTFNSYTVTARCIPLGRGYLGAHHEEDVLVKLSVVSQAAAPAIGYLSPSPWANGNLSQYPFRASPVAALAPVVLSSAIPSQDQRDTGVPDDATGLQAAYGVGNLWVYLSAATFSDDPSFNANITGVLDSPLFRNCRGKITTTNVQPSRPAPSADFFSKLFDNRHGAFLASYADGIAVTLQTPPALAGMFNAFVDVTATPVYFWKDDASDVWALCRLANIDGSSQVSESTASNLMPYTGNLVNDLFVADDLIGAVIDPNHPPSSGPATLLAQGTIYDALPCVMLKARMIDLATIRSPDPNIGDHLQKQTVKADVGSSVQFQFLGITASAPVDPPIIHWGEGPFAGATGSPPPGFPEGQIDSITEVVVATTQYELHVRFSGSLSPSASGGQTFTGQVVATFFGLNMNAWGNVARIPDAQLNPPGKVRTGYDIQGSRVTYQTQGDPFSLGELVDLRPLMWPAAPSEVTIGSNGGASQVWAQAHNVIVYDQVLTAPDPVTGTPSVAQWKELTATMWSGFFTGVYFLVTDFQRNVLSTGGTSDEASTIRWGNIANVGGAIGIAWTTPGVDVEQGVDSAPGVTSYTRLDHYQLIREHRGALATLGTLDDMLEVSGDPQWFTPSSASAALGLTAWHSDASTQPLQSYRAIAHVDTGYVEKFPPSFSFPPATGYAMGRLYKGTPVEDAVFAAGAGGGINATSAIRGVEEHVAIATSPHVLYRSTFAYGNQGAANDPVGSMQPFEIDVDEYPSASPFYAPASSGGIPDSGHLPYYKGVALYWPNLRDGKPGFCLLKLGPDEYLVRVIYFVLPFTVADLPALVGYTAKLRDHSAQPIYNSWPAYSSAIAALASKASDLASRPSSNPPNEQDLANLKDLAKTTLRASYVVLANNFAPLDMTDLFVQSAVFIA